MSENPAVWAMRGVLGLLFAGMAICFGIVVIGAPIYHMQIKGYGWMVVGLLVFGTQSASLLWNIGREGWRAYSGAGIVQKSSTGK